MASSEAGSAARMRVAVTSSSEGELPRSSPFHEGLGPFRKASLGIRCPILRARRVEISPSGLFVGWSPLRTRPGEVVATGHRHGRDFLFDRHCICTAGRQCRTTGSTVVARQRRMASAHGGTGTLPVLERVRAVSKVQEERMAASQTGASQRVYGKLAETGCPPWDSQVDVGWAHRVGSFAEQGEGPATAGGTTRVVRFAWLKAARRSPLRRSTPPRCPKEGRARVAGSIVSSEG